MLIRNERRFFLSFLSNIYKYFSLDLVKEAQDFFISWSCFTRLKMPALGSRNLKHKPIMILPTISCANVSSTSVLDENPIISQENMEITLIQIKVMRRPILSSKYPDKRPPIGEKKAVIDANHDA